jgi:hypothetical protein
MLTQNTLETLRHLKLHGMVQALQEQRETPNTHALSFDVSAGLKTVMIGRFKNRRSKDGAATVTVAASTPV